MDIFQSIIATRVLFILGIINLVSVLLIFFSCRCIPGSKILGKIMKYQAYQRFFRYHCYIWLVFWSSVVVHAILGIAILGIPF